MSDTEANSVLLLLAVAAFVIGYVWTVLSKKPDE
jgi:hypothetical protein